MGIWYATREAVSLTLEAADTSRSASLIDRKIEAASRTAESCLHRRFYPALVTVEYDWPNYQYVAPWQLWLDDNEAISIISMVAGGTTIDAADRFLRRGDNKAEPPYSYIEIDQASAAALQSGDTWQKSIVLSLLTGWNDTDTSAPHATLSGAINSSVLTGVLNPSTGPYEDLGVGSLLLIGTERLQVIGRRYSAVTGQTLGGNLEDHQSVVSIPVTSGAAFSVGESILIDSEKMRVTEIAGNTLVCDRAFDGTVLDTHTSGASIYARRTFTFKRGVLGSTAASHSDTDSVYVHAYPEPLPELVIAEVCAAMGVETHESFSDYLKDLRERAYYTLGRVSRIGAI